LSSIVSTTRVVLVALLLQTSLVGAQDEDELPPGLRVRYEDAGTAIERVDPDVAFVWGTRAPDERLIAGPFRARWTGTLLVQSGEAVQFFAYVQGKVHLSIDGRVLLDRQTATAQWVRGPATDLPYGDLPFELEYTRSAPEGQLKLYWSARDFPLEPVPAHVFTQAAPSTDLALQERGRHQFAAYRCHQCHGADPTREKLEAPSLKSVGAGTRRDWLIAKLRHGAADAEPADPQSQMPQFGFSREDAEAILAALMAQRETPAWLPITRIRPADQARELAAGQTLLRSVGCLACHSWQTQGASTPYGGGSLDSVGRRRSAEWLTTWLTDPARINPRHRMPVVPLSEKERSQLVLALGGDAVEDSVPKPDSALVDRGTRLIAAARCTACHDIPGQAPVKPLPSLGPGSDWERGCSQPPDQTRLRPSLAQADFVALRATAASWTPGTVPGFQLDSSSSLPGSDLLIRKNCVACHDRDSLRGLSRFAAQIAARDESLAGLHMTLIPPRLNAVGDRMHEAGLTEAIQGRQPTVRLNWLRVRMPRFAHSPAELQALRNHLIGHDRIPEGAPAGEVIPTPATAVERSQRILAGRELLGGKGFSCVACHAVRDYTPRVTALGTRGANLHGLGERMRRDYYFRWMRAPLRVMPGVEMPNYQRPHEFILPGQLDLQLAAIWEALNDPQLTAPTNPAVVEQWLAVGPTDPPRVVRDVFTVPGRPQETVARPFAVGLPGGHSVLIDLDTGSVRGWTLGDFARQRCEGKRWYWDLAGTPLMSEFGDLPELVLVTSAGTWIAPEHGGQAEWTFRDETRTPRAVTLVSDVRWTQGDARYDLTVTQTLAVSDEPRGWRRTLHVTGPAGVWPWLREPQPAFRHAQASLQLDGAEFTPVEGLPVRAARFPTGPDGHARLTIHFDSSLQWQPVPLQTTQPPLSRDEPVTAVPGFAGRRLPLIRSVMPTALTWDSQGNLLVTSLKGHLYELNRETRPESLTLLEDGLAAPFGILESRRPGASGRPDVIVAHKPELLRLQRDSRGGIEDRSVLATGWGVTDDYHDWTCGIVRDSTGTLYVGLGSDYTFKNRPRSRSRWRGDILKIDEHGTVESIARGLRYPVGLAIDDQDHLFCSDQQGVQNTYNEINHILTGRRYGVPSRHEPEPEAPAEPAAIQVPHPWTRSVNGIVWIPRSLPGWAPLAGQFLGCEFNNHQLIRFSVQPVDGQLQGAVYPFSRPATENETGFLGPLCLGISPRGELVVGSLQDGGWAGGLNLGDLVELTPTGTLPNGIREIRATSRGFDIEFFAPISPTRAARPESYQISGATRVWKGEYATADSGRHTAVVSRVAVSADRQTVSLAVDGLKAGNVYDISVREITPTTEPLWPTVGHYTLHRIPGN